MFCDLRQRHTTLGSIKERVFQRKGKKKKTVGSQMTENETGLKIRRVYNICVANPFTNKLPRCFIYFPFLRIAETSGINVEDVATVLFRRDAPFVAHLLQKNIHIY